MNDEDEDEKPGYRPGPYVESPQLGSGMAEQARQNLINRRRKIEDAIEEATKGTKKG